MTIAAAGETADPGPTAKRPAEHTMPLSDGTELFYRAWLPDHPVERAVVLFHRGHEHSGRFVGSAHVI